MKQIYVHAPVGVGSWVAIKHSDRVGMIAEIRSGRVLVQFGAGGPFEWYPKKQLRVATENERDIAEGIA